MSKTSNTYIELQQTIQRTTVGIQHHDWVEQMVILHVPLQLIDFFDVKGNSNESSLYIPPRQDF